MPVIPAPDVYAIADIGGSPDVDAWLETVATLAATGVTLQIRAKGHPFELRAAAVARAIAAGGRPRPTPTRGPDEALIAAGAGAPVFLNGTLAEARAAGAAGVHWPEADIPAGPVADTGGLRVAASVHSPDAARRAAIAGADFVLFGPVFDPISKPGHGRGLAALARVVAASPRPVLALGGVTPDRVAACRAAGAAGIAVCGGVMQAPDPAAAVAAYRAAAAAFDLQEPPCP